MLTEDLHHITLMAVDACDVDHSHIHADITHILRLLAVNQTVTTAVAKMTVQTVGISYRYGGNDRIVVYLSLAAIAYSVAGRHMAHLEDCGLKRGYGVYDSVVTRINTVEAKSQTTHIHLSLREVLDACRVVHVTQYLMCECRLQLTASLIEEGKLTGGEIIEAIAVGTYEMAEHRARDNSILMLKTVDKLIHVVDRIEA